MKILIFILILAAFLQASILPFNLVLLILVLRSYIVSEREDLFLAFFFGLLVSHLEVTPLGDQSLIYLILVECARVIGRLPLSNNILTVLFLAFFSTCFNNVAIDLTTGASIQLFPNVFISTVLAIPIYVALRFWEERFVVRPEIRLKVK